MPDISMCSGKYCLKKDSCYRHQAEPNVLRQSWFGSPPFDKKTGECNYFMELWNKKDK